MEPIDIATLISYHKSEASEELTYVTIIFTIVFGLFGYLGSVKRIEKPVRVSLAIVFAMFYYMFFSSLLGSMKIHDALHLETKNYIEKHPSLFLQGKESALYKTLCIHMTEHNITGIVWSGVGFGLLVILGILLIGRGGFFTCKMAKSRE